MPDLGRAAKALSRAAISAAKAQGAGGSYITTRFSYSDGLAGFVADYLNGGNARSTLNAAKRMVVEKLWEAGQRGFRDGAEDASAELSSEDSRYLVQRQNDELDFIDNLWDDLAERRKQDPVTFPQDRIDQYTNSLDDVYNALKLRGAANITLEFFGNDGIQSCSTCARLQGKRHPAKWWIENDMIPGAANPNYKCGGFRCQHALRTPSGKRFTL
ncbi:MAG: hypothetical protein H0U60_02525 [Blastocatellia bacterium]|nr:hypothetical protein [Blastocatellia bacterium]